MNDEIRPALTAEEWAAGKFRRARPEDGGRYWIGAQVFDGTVDISGSFDGTVADTPEQRHALAALCLHEQPYGFSHDDVDVLRHAADGLEHHGIPWPQLYAIADRIAALLPPRPESE
jgi:hypothetical protein